VFAIYNNTMEARALALMGQKRKAGQTLYGDEVGGAIVPEDEGDLLLKLAREALSKADIPDLQSLFAENCHVERPAISITEIETAGVDAELTPAYTPAAPTKTTMFDAWMDGRGTDSLNSGRKKKNGRGPDVPFRPGELNDCAIMQSLYCGLPVFVPAARYFSRRRNICCYSRLARKLLPKESIIPHLRRCSRVCSSI